KPAKQRKMTHCDGKKAEVRVSENGKLWSVDTDVEPEFLEDMGVKLLGDEEDSNKSKLKGSKSPLGVELLSDSNSDEKKLPPKKRDQRTENPVSEDFFLYRRRLPMHMTGIDVFSKLSDELILMIFKMLPKTMLARCSLVCKRWQRISYDEALWIKMDLGSKTLAPNSLGHLLSRGTLALRLAQAEISDPIFYSSCSLLSNDVECKLQYLDLSMAVITEEGLASLLSVCRYLRKLSLEHCRVSEKVCLAISRNPSLEVLNMSACYGVTDDCIISILDGCKKILSLNLGWTNMSVDTLDVLCTDLPHSLQRINMSGCRKTLTDDHVEQLVASCPELVELDLSDCTTLTARTISLVSTLHKIEYLALSRCYSITPSAYLQLKSVKTLMYLDVFNLMSDQSIANLQQNLPEVEINKFLFSSVARPTVGIRRTSIWGLRVRD
ncbi:hypothetical protein L9F63_001832, partial [Diploptera punctata]